jgi:hypothetical protein
MQFSKCRHCNDQWIAFRDITIYRSQGHFNNVFVMSSWRCGDVNLWQISPISTHFSLFKTQKSLFPCCLRYNCCQLMRIDTSRAVMEHPSGSDMYRLDASCLVNKPKYVTMPGVCQSILITHWLGNRGQHLLWRHRRGMLLMCLIIHCRMHLHTCFANFVKFRSKFAEHAFRCLYSSPKADSLKWIKALCPEPHPRVLSRPVSRSHPTTEPEEAP